MGYDLDRFPDQTVDSVLLCPICLLVLENPLEIRKCQHAFCQRCIKKWLTMSKTCPNDRRDITDGDLVPPHGVISRLLGTLKITCENKHLGCHELVSLDRLSDHQDKCKHRQNKQYGIFTASDMWTYEDTDISSNITVTNNEILLPASVEPVAAHLTILTQTTSSLSSSSSSTSSWPSPTWPSTTFWESYRRRCPNCGSADGLTWACYDDFNVLCDNCHLTMPYPLTASTNEGLT